MPTRRPPLAPTDQLLDQFLASFTPHVKFFLAKGEKDPVLLPRFSCHNLRHTFATRLCEADVNIKVIQELLGHSDFSTTMDIYTDVTKDLKEREINKLNGTFSEMMIITPSTPISTPSLL